MSDLQEFFSEGLRDACAGVDAPSEDPPPANTTCGGQGEGACADAAGQLANLTWEGHPITCQTVCEQQWCRKTELLAYVNLTEACPHTCDKACNPHADPEKIGRASCRERV